MAELAGEGWRAWLLPVSVDGLVVAASMSMLVRRRVGLPAGVAWTALLAGIGASLAANVAAADPMPVGRFVAAQPTVALLLAWELLVQVRAGKPCRQRVTVISRAKSEAVVRSEAEKTRPSSADAVLLDATIASLEFDPPSMSTEVT